jgi:hypothetical protein
MKKIFKMVAVAGVGLLLLPGLVFALTLPAPQTFNFLNPDPGATLAATIEVAISWEVVDESLRYDYTMTNYGFNPTGFLVEAISKVTVPVGGLEDFGWDPAASDPYVGISKISDGGPFSTAVTALEFNFKTLTGAGLAPGVPGDSQSFFLVSTNAWDLADFVAWDTNSSISEKAFASVSGAVGNDIRPVPEPSMLLLLGGSLLGLAGLLRRQKR